MVLSEPVERESRPRSPRREFLVVQASMVGDFEKFPFGELLFPSRLLNCITSVVSTTLLSLWFHSFAYPHHADQNGEDSACFGEWAGADATNVQATALKSIKSLAPLLDRVLVQRVKAEAKTATGIFLPENAVKELNEAKVLAVGPGAMDMEGKRLPMGVQAGDKVLIPQVRQTRIDSWRNDLAERK